MNQIEKIEDFYQMPENKHLLSKEVNIVKNFNVFRRWNCSSVKTFIRRDFYRIVLILGTGTMKYADKSIEIDKPTLFLANKTIPYAWIPVSEKQEGWVCLFSSEFLNSANNTKEKRFPILHSSEMPVYSLNKEQLNSILTLFENISEEFNSDYLFKDNLLQNYLALLLHQIQKLEPSSYFSNQPMDAAHRTTYRFFELLEQQFPIQSPQNPLLLKNPREFASQLNMHVNNMNHSVKKVTGKTSSALISERIILEAKSLLKNTDWNISEISEALSFDYTSHFTNFFRKHTQISPKMLRSESII